MELLIQEKFQRTFLVADTACKKLAVFRSPDPSPKYEFQVKLENLYREVEYYKTIGSKSFEEQKLYLTDRRLRRAMDEFCVAGKQFIAVLTSGVGWTQAL